MVIRKIAYRITTARISGLKGIYLLILEESWLTFNEAKDAFESYWILFLFVHYELEIL